MPCKSATPCQCWEKRNRLIKCEFQPSRFCLDAQHFFLLPFFSRPRSLRTRSLVCSPTKLGYRASRTLPDLLCILPLYTAMTRQKTLHFCPNPIPFPFFISSFCFFMSCSSQSFFSFTKTFSCLLFSFLFPSLTKKKGFGTSCNRRPSTLVFPKTQILNALAMQNASI